MMKSRTHVGETMSLASRWQRHERMVRLGQVLMGVGVVVVLVHVMMHLTGSPSGWTDLIAGYPTGGIVAMVGAVLAGRRAPQARG